jgi:hypothetical protein
MSVNYTAKVFWGVKLDKSSLEVRTPNPLWDNDKTKFDSKTGERITEDLLTHIYPEDLAKKFKVEYVETHREDIIFGGELCDEVDIDYGDPISEIKWPIEEDKLAKAKDVLAKLLDSSDEPAQEPKLYLVTNVS